MEFSWLKPKGSRPHIAGYLFDFYFLNWEYVDGIVETKLMFKIAYCSKSFLEDGTIGAVVEMNVKDVDGILITDPCGEGSIGYFAQFYRVMFATRAKELVAEMSKILGITLATPEPPTTEDAKHMVRDRLSYFFRSRDH